MKDFPKYFNSADDYVNMLSDWPPAYGCQRSKMLQEIDALMASAKRVEAVHDDDGSLVEYVEVDDPNGKMARIGLDAAAVSAMLTIVAIVDPAIEAAELAIETGDVTGLSAIVASGDLDGSDLPMIDSVGKMLKTVGRKGASGLSSLIDAWKAYRTDLIGGIHA